MVTKAQLRKIWASAREVGLEEEELRDLVEDLSGSRSISALSFERVGELIDVLVKLGATPGQGRRPKPRGRATGEGEILLITGRQRSYIQELREQIGGDFLRDEYFEGACRRVIRKPRPRTAADGVRIIEMLKRRLAWERSKHGDETA